MNGAYISTTAGGTTVRVSETPRPTFHPRCPEQEADVQGTILDGTRMPRRLVPGKVPPLPGAGRKLTHILRPISSPAAIQPRALARE
jgi:hypothetical protein